MPADRGHGGGEVAQVVEPDVGASDLVAGLVEAVPGMILLACWLRCGAWGKSRRPSRT